MSLTWGHSKMSNGSDYYGFLEHKEYIDAFWYPSDWLDSEWSKDKQTAFNDLYSLGLFGWYPFRDEFDKILDARNTENYFERYDLDYKDVSDPRKLINNGSSGIRIIGNSLNFVSSNVKRLYR